MKSVTIAFVLLFTAGFAFAQHTQGTSAGFAVASTIPADNATNVPASTTTVSITFNDVVDTTMFTVQGKGNTGCIITNFETLTAVSFSADHKTVILTVTLAAGKPYFFGVYSAKNASHVAMAVPSAFHFTTGASFPSTTLSGTVASGSSGVGTANAFVALSTVPLSQGDPIFTAGTIADGNGNFTVPYVPNGTIYPLAAKDVSGDGSIDPSSGDVVGQTSGVTVNGANITGVTITFASSQPYRFKDAVDTLNAHKGGFPTPNTLKLIEGSTIDSLGRAGTWEFDYTGTSWQTSFVFRVQTFGTQMRAMDSSQYTWVSQAGAVGTLPTPAAVDTFLARAERNGGYAYRPVPMSWNGFDAYLNIGKLWWQGFGDLVTDPSASALGMTYWYGIEGQNQSTTIRTRRFVGDYTTGAILGTTAVSPTPGGDVPARYALGQNYPNPFNPSTV
ncbi:MAG TPA: Ig-like domain-containing protein, partial [Bacteroidota bacterium]|nr:Ig-like domain-containing protein [Bacteroidota bacterium]